MEIQIYVLCRRRLILFIDLDLSSSQIASKNDKSRNFYKFCMSMCDHVVVLNMTHLTGVQVVETAGQAPLKITHPL